MTTIRFLAIAATLSAIVACTEPTVPNLNNPTEEELVTITDRGPFVAGRVIDVTPAAARALGFSGLAPVNLEVTGRADKGEVKVAMRSDRKTRRHSKSTRYAKSCRSSSCSSRTRLSRATQSYRNARSPG